MHMLWNIVQVLFVIGLFAVIGVIGLWGLGQGELNVGRIFGENSKSHWYAKDYDKRQF
jgi:hypothetical protein